VAAVTQLPGQIELFPPGWDPGEHGPMTHVEAMRYVMHGKNGPETRELHWERFVCWCGADSCDIGWRK
jgi:hypothetical protein